MHVIPRSDVIVVGAGIVGASCAYALASRGLQVTVVEAFKGPAEGSSGRSFASVRAQWADPLNIELSWRSICSYRDFATNYGVDVGYRPTGYLLLVRDQAWAAQLEAVELQREYGVPVEVLDIEGAVKITPFATAGIAGATWGPADGVVDPHLVTTTFLSMARALGTQVLFGRRVTEVAAAPSDGGWTVTAGGTTLHSQHLVNAAGGWAGEVAALAGFSVPVVHSRRNVYATAPRALPAPLPMTIDVGSGVYLRSEGSRLLFGAGRPGQADGYDVTVDWPWMETVLKMGVERFPWLGDLPLDRAACWAGTYENTPDLQAILGADPTAPTWINACGLSGHGVIQAPEFGRLVAEQVLTGAITSLDVGALSLARFAGSAHSAQAAGLVF